MDEKLDLILEELHEIKQKVSRLENGQSEMKRELYRVDRMISDTYNLTLDAWGQGAENREWLKSKNA